MGVTIYGKTIPDNTMQGIIAKIKEKRELVHLDPEVCQKHIIKYLMLHGKILSQLAKDFAAIQRSKEVTQIVKAIREEIHHVYGVYQTQDIGKIAGCLDKLEKDLKNKPIEKTKEDHDKILRLHRSTTERLESYEHFFEDIFAITGKPKSIIDLACGLNPMAWPYYQLRNIRYYAYEMNDQDVKYIQQYFQIIQPHTNIQGEAIRLDITKDALPTVGADICLLLKVLDLIEPIIAEKIITTVKATWFVISFPTKTITDQEMRFKRRAGFQKMLRRLGIRYQTLSYDNEIVYIFKRTP